MSRFLGDCHVPRIYRLPNYCDIKDAIDFSLKYMYYFDKL